MQRLEVSGAVRLIYGSLGVKGLMWLGIGTNVEVLGTRSWTSGFQILHRICWPSDEMLPSPVRPCSLMINNVLGVLRISTAYFPAYCLQRCSAFVATGTAFIYFFQSQGLNIYIHFDKLTPLRGVHLRNPTHPLPHSLTHPPTRALTNSLTHSLKKYSALL